MDLLIPLLTFLIPLVVFGLIIGRTVEKRHFRRLDESDAEHAGILVTQLKSFPGAVTGEKPPGMVVAEVVIGSDYLKSFLAQWRKIFGGEIRSFQTLPTRARREAISRLRQAAISQGYNALCNVRIDSVDIGGAASAGRNKTPMASVIASATAYYAGRSD